MKKLSVRAFVAIGMLSSLAIYFNADQISNPAISAIFDRWILAIFLHLSLH